ncbi:MAG: hypothetical protein HOP12_03740, partial [Candidatus Eisenbacteria bacterium]|nr:hypothetical protein [Candidatus Eisenbacteria bacterium]
MTRNRKPISKRRGAPSPEVKRALSAARRILAARTRELARVRRATTR